MRILSSLSNRLKFEWFWLKLSYKFRFAHHPVCEPYSNQVFRVLGVHFCQGCTLFTIGVFTSIILSFGVGVNYTLVSLFMIFLGVVFFVGIVDGISSPRIFKQITRIIMGLGLGIALYVVFFNPNWMIKIVSLFLLYSMYRGYGIFRSVYPSKDLCSSCSLFSEAPYCPGLIMQMEANKEYQKLALPLFEAQVARKLGIDSPQSVAEKMDEIGKDQEFEIVWS